MPSRDTPVDEQVAMTSTTLRDGFVHFDRIKGLSAGVVNPSRASSAHENRLDPEGPCNTQPVVAVSALMRERAGDHHRASQHPGTRGSSLLGTSFDGRHDAPMTSGSPPVTPPHPPHESLRWEEAGRRLKGAGFGRDVASEAEPGYAPVETQWRRGHSHAPPAAPAVAGHAASSAAAVLRSPTRSASGVDTIELVPAARTFHESAGPVVRHSADQAARSRLDGSSLDGPGGPKAAQSGIRQVSTVLLRLRVGHRVPGQKHYAHQLEYRAHMSHNGRDILRYSLYQDPDACYGFSGRELGANYSLTLFERYIVEPQGDAPAEIHIRYTGGLTLHSVGQVRFKGTLVLLGSGKALPGRPELEGAAGRAHFTDGCVTIGMW